MAAVAVEPLQAISEKHRNISPAPRGDSPAGRAALVATRAQLGLGVLLTLVVGIVSIAANSITFSNLLIVYNSEDYNLNDAIYTVKSLQGLLASTGIAPFATAIFWAIIIVRLVLQHRHPGIITTAVRQQLVVTLPWLVLIILQASLAIKGYDQAMHQWAGVSEEEMMRLSQLWGNFTSYELDVWSPKKTSQAQLATITGYVACAWYGIVWVYVTRPEAGSAPNDYSSQTPHMNVGGVVAQTVGGTTMTTWSDFQRAADECALAGDELEVALDAMCAMNTPFFFRYNILSAVHRRMGGQGLVQFASVANSQQRAAIKFYLDRAAFERERELYTQSELRAMMPATLAIDDNASGDAVTPYGYKFPPFVIIECGQSLDEWARHNSTDFITIFQSLSHAVRALARLHSCGYAHRDIKPGNILRRPNQHDWTLIDFGCTAKIGTVASLSYSLRYTPPEVVRELEAGRKTIKVDSAVDIWAIGVIAYELLTGARALPTCGLEPEAAEVAALDAISGRTPLPWEQHDAEPALDMLRGLKRTVLLCLERDPVKRPSSEALLASWDHTFDNMQSQGTVFTRISDETRG